jgi:hypothetical protein
MASRLFTVDLDLGLNKAKRFIFEDFSSAPTGTIGRVIYWTAGDSSANHLKVYNGTAWKTVAYTDDVPDISISLEAATGFTVSGSPADASGTLTFEWDEVAPGYVLAGALDANTSPAPGNSIPTFRALGEQDIPVEIARVEDVNTSLEDYILLTEKGEPLGVAELDENGYVPISQLDLTGVSATVTGTTGQINVEDTGTNDYVVSLPDTVTLGTDGNKGRLLLGNANYAAAGSFEIDNSDQLTISSDYGDIFLATASGSTAYLGSITSGSQIATIGDIQALDAYDITSTQISNWDTAYGWGNHALSGYLTTAVLSVSNSDTNLVVGGDSENVTIDLASTIGVSTINTASATGSLFDNGPSLITFGIITPEIEIGSDEGTVTINNDLIVTGDLTVNGDVTTLNTATMNVEDNIFVLNSNVTGTPSVDAGIEVERGTSTNASLIWSESDDTWTAGLAGSEIAIARKFVTTTTGTTHTVTHNLSTSDVTVNCWLAGEQVEASIVVTDANTVTVTTNTSITDLKTVVVG